MLICEGTKWNVSAREFRGRPLIVQHLEPGNILLSIFIRKDLLD